MRMLEHVQLQRFNTLALPAIARYFCRVSEIDELAEALRWARRRELPLLLLGGGSNVVLAGDWPGLVLQIGLLGRSVVEADRDDGAGAVAVEVAAGESWHDLVQWSLAQQLYGLENLTLIPGSVGAAPVQNIGAYGVELADRLVSVRGWSLADDCEVTLSAADCRLGYRDSIFKGALRDRFVITAVSLELSREDRPVATYPALADVLQAARKRQGTAAVTSISAMEVERTVRAMRQSKLPDPSQLPNAGSFFKNPIISRAGFERLAAQWPDLPGFPVAAGDSYAQRSNTRGDADVMSADAIKIPAAWLLDRAGWKGKRRGSVGVHDRQALVLIHSGGSDGRALLALAQDIRNDVQRRFDVVLELEPCVFGGADLAHSEGDGQWQRTAAGRDGD